MPRKPKTSSKRTLLRQWTMLRMIPRSPRVIGTSELITGLASSGFDADLRTIQRDLNNLSEVLPLGSDQHKPQGWSWLPQAGQFDIPGLEPQAALAFHMAEAHLQSVLPASTLASLLPWFDTARAVLDDHGNGLAKWPNKVRVLPRGLPLKVPAIRPDVQAAAYQAVLQDCKLRVVYSRNGGEVGEGEPASHVVSPLALVVRGGIVYLVCVYDGHSDPRQLALHRMREAELLIEPARRPKGFSIDDYITEGEFGVSLNPRPIKLEAEFYRHVAIYLRESPISDDQTITELDEDNILLRATVPDTLELRLWLKSFGDEVAVLKPVALRREFRAMAENLKDYYAD
ncbi:MAG: WYL domain-containing protein [Sulfuritalea sp.]|nr:WYL domain-containing protein [Sulfuritalea sp.]MDP1984723.1 WYL domain-containing protein [Sulfuritalea sp.]